MTPGTGAITSAIYDAPASVDDRQSPRLISPEAATETLLEGQKAGFYGLPAGLLRAASGAAALQTAAFLADSQRRERFSLGWEASARSNLAVRFREAALKTGSLPSIDAGAELAALRLDEARLADESAIYATAAAAAELVPSWHARNKAEEIGTMLDAALRETIAAARPHSARISKLGPDADALAALRADPVGYDALERLVPRLEAIEAAGQALAALGKPWEGAPADDGDSAVIRLARLATETPSEG
jgi:hypothetical protein